MAENDLEGAKASALDYVRIVDDNDFAWYMLGLIYLNLGDASNAKKYGQKAIDVLKSQGVEAPKEYYDLLGN